MKKLILLFALCAFLLGIWQETAQAIPAFARRYRLSCKTCHNPFPRLSAYGADFAANAFQLPDGPEPARSFVDTGDEKLDLLREFPVAVRFDLHGRYMPDNENTENDFRFPDRLKFLSAGALTKDIAIYFYFYMSEHGDLTGVEDAYVHFNNIGGVEFDVMAGQFQVSDPLFKRELRLTYEDYWLYKQKIGESQISLAYDRGFILTYSPMDGTDLVFEVLNGNGIDGRNDQGNMDNDSFKNIFFRGLQSLGETGLSAGVLFYYGEDTQREVTDEVNYWGVDVSYDWKESLTVNFQYLERRDSDPFFTGLELDEDIVTKGTLLEVIYGPKANDSNFYFVLLYNLLDSDVDVYDYESIALNVTHLIRRNFKVFAEYGRDIEYEANVFTGGLVTAF